MTSQFVILEHVQSEGVHYDLMLRVEDSLATWRLPHLPEADTEADVFSSARRIFDHPLKFLNYEGPVQNASAHVRRIDAGTYELIHRNKTEWLVELTGQKTRSRLHLPL